MSPFNFDQNELLTFFAVLVRFSVLCAVLPFLGDRIVPMTVKVLFSLVTTIALFPPLVRTGLVVPAQAAVWGESVIGIVRVVGLEALFGVLMGFTARLVFDAITFGSNLVGTFMGLSAATMFDPHHETQSQVIAEFYLALAMLIFLALDGHHLMLRAALDSYRWVSMGQVDLSGPFAARILELTATVIRYGLQLAAPVGIAVFALNVAFGVVARAMPQVNILVLSFAVTMIVGFLVMLITISDFNGAMAEVLSKIGDWMVSIARAVGNG
ncbi:MAG: flagellar biosynthetic protein FliR [Bdellovibrionales bacterium]|nr:flagellar biosynthetic protein FliR [Bdellovibrionales bacterium]